LVDLLEFLVISRKTDLLFLFLVGEYRLAPTKQRAVALFDVFCSQRSPIQLRVREILPPRDHRLTALVDKLRAEVEGRDGMEAAAGYAPRYLFDDLVKKIEDEAGSEIGALESSYDPALEPAENLPAGRMTGEQRWFVDNLWQPQVRPYLAAAGFRWIANVG
jgi:hypothetical protein